MKRLKRGDRKPAIPSAIPPITPNGTAITIDESVSIALAHWPKAARYRKAQAASTANPAPPAW